jgi:hypothetical protein
MFFVFFFSQSNSKIMMIKRFLSSLNLSPLMSASVGMVIREKYLIITHQFFFFFVNCYNN